MIDWLTAILLYILGYIDFVIGNYVTDKDLSPEDNMTASEMNTLHIIIGLAWPILVLYMIYTFFKPKKQQ